MRIVEGKHEYTCANCGCHDNDPDVDDLLEQLAAMTAAKNKAVEALKESLDLHRALIDQHAVSGDHLGKQADILRVALHDQIITLRELIAELEEV